MPIDPAGTAPGHIPTPSVEPKIHMRCQAQGCDNVLASEVKTEGDPLGQRLYRCCKCGTVRGISTGGACPF